MSNPSQTCEVCGARLPVNALDEPCPACLVRSAIGQPSDQGPSVPQEKMEPGEADPTTKLAAPIEQGFGQGQLGEMAALIAQIGEMIDDAKVQVSLPSADTPEGARAAELMKTAPKLQPSAKDTSLYRALQQSATSTWAGAPVTTYLFQAGTDAIAWRRRGVPVYGIYPYPISSEDLTRMHGNDERVPIDSLEQGTEMIYKTLVQVVSE